MTETVSDDRDCSSLPFESDREGVAQPVGVNALFDPGPSGKSGEEMSDIRRSTWRRCRRSTAANTGSVRMPQPVVEDCWRKMRPPRDGDQAGDIR
jgi:hypothetical protein